MASSNDQRKYRAIPLPGDVPSTPAPWTKDTKVTTTKTTTKSTTATTHATVPSGLNSYVPSVLVSAQAAKSPTPHKIHVLGEDARSKFIAHALSGLYESVEMLGWTPRQHSTRYSNIQFARQKNQRKASDTVKNAAIQSDKKAKEDNSLIDRLVVSGSGHEAVAALNSVKHRLNKDTTVCLMNDGLGVLEEVRKRVFEGTMDTPDFLLGHMSHKLAFNRRLDAVKQLRFGQLLVTPPYTTATRTQSRTSARTNFVESLKATKHLNPSMATYDEWLRFKLPTVIFNAVVETVCVLLDTSYRELLQNTAGRRMMSQLLDEIVVVLENIPELRGSAAIRKFVQGKSIQSLLYQGIMAKKSQPSDLVRRLETGLPTDVEYCTGYFISRAQQIGADMPFNTMMRDMVKARHSRLIESRNSYIPFEETSIPSELGFRYRTSRR